jgi:hypothetical protein
VKIAKDGSLPPLFTPQIQQLNVRGIPRIQSTKININHKLVINRLCEDNVVNPPSNTVREKHPVHALIRRIINGLFYVGELKS